MLLLISAVLISDIPTSLSFLLSIVLSTVSNALDKSIKIAIVIFCQQELLINNW